MGEARAQRCRLQGCRRPAAVVILLDPLDRVETCRVCAMKAKQLCAAVGLDLDVRDLAGPCSHVTLDVYRDELAEAHAAGKAHPSANCPLCHPSESS